MDDERKIALHPLTFLPDGEGVSIGRFGTDTFALFPEDGAELVRQLQAGLTVGEAARWYKQTYQEDLDMDDFLEILRDLTFLNEEGDAPADGGAVRGHRAGKWAFSPLAWVLYALVIGTAGAFLWSVPELRPARHHVFYSEYSTFVIFGLFLGILPGVLFHETMHMLAGWRLGLPSKLSVGRRMFFLVFESSMPGLAGLPRKERYLPILSGMFGDVLYFSLMVVVAGVTLTQTGELNGFARFCLAVAFTTVLRFIWQFYFHLQTDIYYAIVTALGCVNLQETARQYLRNFWYRLIGASHKCIDPSKWAERDAQVTRWYGPLYAVGYVLFLCMFLFVIVPILYQLLANVVWNLLNGSTVYIWDSLVVIAVVGVQYGTVGWLFIRERRAIAKGG
ncbi:hypothetical protein OS242_12475 [Tumebacillus sp. DT12]|uniref:PqqD family protein n=1 Tax=Tumebacillus lacus TaxID=2995335 RepID=A0ABT3X1I4_9BACL|nr:hypothetical protein [Tumebacillus lacus]MCX7570774.1 hypothetical protein [Tumebacillus lacus]